MSKWIILHNDDSETAINISKICAFTKLKTNPSCIKIFLEGDTDLCFNYNREEDADIVFQDLIKAT